jgi:RsiW-degrading membrane proteinase PrsW (M82 family)
MPHLLAQSALSFLPVLVFLGALELIDTYKLVRLRRVLQVIGVGCAVGLVCYGLNTVAVMALGIRPGNWGRLGAPCVEEVLKSLVVVALIRAGRVGFMVDAAICGFAVGTGFAIVENLFYLPIISSAGLATAAVRGLGTAMMHGGTTAIFGLISVNLAEFGGSDRLQAYLPGLSIAVLIHAFYNQAFLAPVTAAALLLVLLPLMFSLIFWQSEKVLERWMGTKLDKDMDLLHMIATSTFSQSHAGKYLRSLENSFEPIMLGDLLCYLQLSLELGAQAKGNLLLREMGFPVADDATLPARLKELGFLEKQIGRAGKLALAPLLGTSRRNMWEIHQLTEGGVR